MKFVIIFAACLVTVLAAPISAPKKGDFRSEFDFLLVSEVHDGLARSEESLLRLTHQIEEVEKTKSKAEQTKIIEEIDGVLSYTTGAEAAMKRELQRTDLNILEEFNFQLLLQSTQLLVKDLTAALNKVKAIQTK